MMALHRKKKQEAKAEELKNDVKLLKRRHDATLAREKKMRDDINSGKVESSTAYRLPLSTLPSPSNSRAPTIAMEDLGVLRRTSLTKYELSVIRVFDEPINLSSVLVNDGRSIRKHASQQWIDPKFEI